jgi:hypothetical protein
VRTNANYGDNILFVSLFVINEERRIDYGNADYYKFQQLLNLLKAYYNV